MTDIIGGFVDNPAEFRGTLETYCGWDEDYRTPDTTEDDLYFIDVALKAKSAALMRRPTTFTLCIHDVAWDEYDSE